MAGFLIEQGAHELREDPMTPEFSLRENSDVVPSGKSGFPVLLSSLLSLFSPVGDRVPSGSLVGFVPRGRA